MIFTPVSELFILFFLSTPFWHLLMVSRAAGHRLKQTIIVGSVAMIWCLLAFAIVKYRADSFLLGTEFPARPLLYLVLASLIAYLCRHWILGSGVSQHLLIGLQLIRPIGMVFVIEHASGNLPAVFAYPAGLGDLLTGVLAAYVLYRYWGKKIPHFWVVLIAAIGRVLLWLHKFRHTRATVLLRCAQSSYRISTGSHSIISCTLCSHRSYFVFDSIETRPSACLVTKGYPLTAPAQSRFSTPTKDHVCKHQRHHPLAATANGRWQAASKVLLPARSRTSLTIRPTWVLVQQSLPQELLTRW